MNRSEAATTLFLWQFQGERDLLRAAGRDGDRTLVSLVESASDARPRHARRTAPPPPPVDFLELDEERAVSALRVRIRALAAFVRPDELRGVEARVRDVMPRGEIAAVHAELERLGARVPHDALQREFEARVVPPPPPEATPPPLRAVLLLSRDGRLLASEGDLSTLDVTALSALVARAEPGSTWSLSHRAGVLVGHVGQRAGLVAVFAGHPSPNVGGTLRASLASLEQKDRLANALTHPSSHQTLTAYVRAVRALLVRNA